MSRVSIAPLVRVTRDGARTDQDLVAVEAPLAIELGQIANGAETVTPLGLFMRTPGDDEALAIGMLYAEGVVTAAADVTAMTLTWDSDEASAVLRAALAPHVRISPETLARSGVANTACGLCGRIVKSGVNAINSRLYNSAPLAPELIFQLPQKLREAQAVFEKTGALHAAGFFDVSAQLIDAAEDVGRHNAVDKLVGRALLQNRIADVPNHVLVVSGRVAYEIVQKAAMAGVEVLVAVGAPSSLAVQAAREAGITLIGFTKDGSFNVYTRTERVA